MRNPMRVYHFIGYGVTNTCFITAWCCVSLLQKSPLSLSKKSSLSVITVPGRKGRHGLSPPSSLSYTYNYLASHSTHHCLVWAISVNLLNPKFNQIQQLGCRFSIQIYEFSALWGSHTRPISLRQALF